MPTDDHVAFLPSPSFTSHGVAQHTPRRLENCTYIRDAHMNYLSVFDSAPTELVVTASGDTSPVFPAHAVRALLDAVSE